MHRWKKQRISVLSRFFTGEAEFFGVFGLFGVFMGRFLGGLFGVFLAGFVRLFGIFGFLGFLGAAEIKSFDASHDTNKSKESDSGGDKSHKEDFTVFGDMGRASGSSGLWDEDF